MTSDFIRPKKSLGQNFLKDPHYLSKIIDAARIGPEDQVVEIGPGLGHLTRLLARKAKRLIAIELDDRLIAPLRLEFEARRDVEIVQADALQYPFAGLPGRWKAVANLPYYISTPLIQKLIEARSVLATMTIMIQREVAERIAADPGGKDYGYLSVLVQLYAEPRIEFNVPPGAFTPKPEVDSTVVTLITRQRPLVESGDPAFLIQVVKAAFAQRRKTLRNALSAIASTREALDRAASSSGIDLRRRGETLSVQEFGRLAEELRAAKDAPST